MSEKILNKLYEVMLLQKEQLDEINSKLDLVLEGMDDSDFQVPEEDNQEALDLFDTLLPGQEDYPGREGELRSEFQQHAPPPLALLIKLMEGQGMGLGGNRFRGRATRPPVSDAEELGPFDAIRRMMGL